MISAVNKKSNEYIRNRLMADFKEMEFTIIDSYDKFVQILTHLGYLKTGIKAHD